MPSGKARVNPVQQRGETERAHQAGQPAIAGKLRPQREKGAGPAVQGACPVDDVEPAQGSLKLQPMAGQVRLRLGDVHPGKRQLTGDAPIVVDFPPAKRTAAIVEHDDRIADFTHATASGRWKEAA